MYKIDFHTHSVASHDGGISAQQYDRALSEGLLDYIAITDHNTADFALSMHELYGEKIIAGEEIMTTQGEIIGLYLNSTIPAGLNAYDTIKLIKDQGGLVYIPHPFETFRKGIDPESLEQIADFIDIIEVCNGRAFLQDRSSQAVVWSRLNNVVGGAGSDAHGYKGLGRTYTNLPEAPNKNNLLSLLDKSVVMTKNPKLRALLYPKYHKIRKRIKKKP